MSPLIHHQIHHQIVKKVVFPAAGSPHKNTLTVIETIFVFKTFCQDVWQKQYFPFVCLGGGSALLLAFMAANSFCSALTCLSKSADFASVTLVAVCCWIFAACFLAAVHHPSSFHALLYGLPHLEGFEGDQHSSADWVSEGAAAREKCNREQIIPNMPCCHVQLRCLHVWWPSAVSHSNVSNTLDGVSSDLWYVSRNSA